jgi:hypothetical protein
LTANWYGAGTDQVPEFWLASARPTAHSSVPVAPGVLVGVAVGVAVAVDAGPTVGVDVGVDVAVAAGFAVGVDVAVAVGVAVAAAFRVGVAVAVGVGVAVLAGPLGVAEPVETALLVWAPPPPTPTIVGLPLVAPNAAAL